MQIRNDSVREHQDANTFPSRMLSSHRLLFPLVLMLLLGAPLASAVRYEQTVVFDVRGVNEGVTVPSYQQPSAIQNWASCPDPASTPGGGAASARSSRATGVASEEEVLDAFANTFRAPMQALTSYYTVITDAYLLDDGGQISVSLEGDGVTVSTVKYRNYAENYVLSTDVVPPMGNVDMREVTFFFYNQPRLHCLYNAPILLAMLQSLESAQAAEKAVGAVGAHAMASEREHRATREAALKALRDQLESHAGCCAADAAPSSREAVPANTSQHLHDVAFRDFLDVASDASTAQTCSCADFMPDWLDVHPIWTPSFFITDAYMQAELDLQVMVFDAEVWYRLTDGAADEENDRDDDNGRVAEPAQGISNAFTTSEAPWIKRWGNSLPKWVSSPFSALTSSASASSPLSSTRRANSKARAYPYNLLRDPAKVCTAPALYTVPLAPLIFAYDSESNNNNNNNNAGGGDSSDADQTFAGYTTAATTPNITHHYPPVRVVVVLAQCSAIPVSVSLSVSLVNSASNTGSAQFYYTSIMFFVFMVGYAIIFIVLLAMIVRCERRDGVKAAALRKAPAGAAAASSSSSSSAAAAAAAAEKSSASGGGSRRGREAAEEEAASSRGSMRKSRKHRRQRGDDESDSSTDEEGEETEDDEREEGRRRRHRHHHRHRSRHHRRHDERDSTDNASEDDDDDSDDDEGSSNNDDDSDDDDDEDDISSSSYSEHGLDEQENEGSRHRRRRRPRRGGAAPETAGEGMSSCLWRAFHTVGDVFRRGFLSFQAWWLASHIDIMFPSLQWLLVVLIPLKCLIMILRAAEFSLLSGMSVVDTSYALPTVSVVLTVCASTVVFVLEVLVALGWGLAYRDLTTGRIIILTLACMFAFAVYVAASTCPATGWSTSFTRDRYARVISAQRCRSIDYTRVAVETFFHFFNAIMMIVCTSHLGKIVAAYVASPVPPLSEHDLSFFYRIDPLEPQDDGTRGGRHPHSRGNSRDRLGNHRSGREGKREDSWRGHRRAATTSPSRTWHRETSAGGRSDAHAHHTMRSSSSSPRGRRHRGHRSRGSSRDAHRRGRQGRLSSASIHSGSSSNSSHGSLPGVPSGRESGALAAEKRRHDAIQVRLMKLYLRYRSMRIPFCFVALWPTMFWIFSFTFFDIGDYYMEVFFSEIGPLYLFCIILLFMRHESFYC